MLKVVIALIVSFFAGFCVAYFIQCIKKWRQKKIVNLDTYSKLVTTAVVAHGMFLTTWSYVLACFGKDSVADVSTTIVREIVAPVIMYLATNTIMNIFEKNKMIFSVPIDSRIISKDRNEEHTEPEEAEG